MTKHIYENRKRFIPVIIKNNFYSTYPMFDFKCVAFLFFRDMEKKNKKLT